MTIPQRNSADPHELAAVSAVLDPGDAPEVAILAAAQAERVAGGISAETYQDIGSVGPFACRDRETHRLVLIADHLRDAGPVDHYQMALCVLRAHCRINATRCDADDAYRRGEWLLARMLYEEAAAATTVGIARDEWQDRSRDCSRQAYRDGLIHVDPGPSTREPRNDWERAQCYNDRGMFGDAAFLLQGPRGHLQLGAAQLAHAGGGSVPPDGTLPDFMSGVSLQVAALCGDRELFERSWALLDSRCKGQWRQRRREILTPDECKEIMGER